MGAKILAVDDNAVNLKIVSATLKQVGYQVITAESGAEALRMVEDVKPDLIVLDISMPEMDGYEVCRRVRSNPETHSIPIIMLTAYSTLEDKIKGLEVGADDYLTKPFQTAELQARVKVILRRSAMQTVKPERKIQGKVISVFSLKGGNGVTTIATNLACGLSSLWGKSVALVDLSFTMGQCALMLNLSLRNTWSDLARISLDEIEPDLLQEVMLKHSSSVSVLAAPKNPADGELISPETVDRVLKNLVEIFDYVVLDLPSDFRETTLAALDHSDQIALVLSPDLASVRAAVGAFEVFDRLGYTEKDVDVMMNWTFKRRGLGRKDIENALKHPIKLVVPFAPEIFTMGINLGIPPVISDPESPIGTLFEDFAVNFGSAEDRQTGPVSPTDAWNRYQKRQSQSRRR